MSGYKNFAVLGAGNMGKYIVEELLRAKAAGTISTVLVLSRSEIDNAEWKAQGAKFAVVDYDSAESFTSAFANIDVVISTVGGEAVDKQADVAKAAKAASVKLFVPSEFGGDTRNVTEDNKLSFPKKRVQAQLKEIDLPYSLFITGGFADWFFTIPPLGFNLAEGKVDIPGDGNTPISLTARPDIARYLTHVLTTFPASKLEWSTFLIEADRLSCNEIVAGYEKKTGKKLEVSYTSRDELKAILAKNPADIFAFIRLILDQGATTIAGKVDNDLFPEWNPKKVLDIIA